MAEQAGWHNGEGRDGASVQTRRLHGLDAAWEAALQVRDKRRPLRPKTTRAAVDYKSGPYLALTDGTGEHVGRLQRAQTGLRGNDA